MTDRSPELISLEWLRVQLVVRIDPTSQASVDASRLRLARPGRPPMPPTRASRAGGAVCARFNVIQGRGQQPLDEGRWTLAQVSDGGTVVPLELRFPADFEQVTEPLQNPLGTRTYVVTPSRDGATLGLFVELRPGRMGASRPRGPGRGGRGRIVHRLWIRAFALSLRLLRSVTWPGRRDIVFMTELSASLTGNLAAIRERIVERGLTRTHRLRIVSRPSPTVPWRLADLVRLPWWLARAAVIVTDGHIELVQVASWQIRTVEVWHAYGAFKLMGYSLAGRPGELSPFSRAYKGYAAVTVGSDADIPVYAEAFGLPEERIHPTGIPRVDRFFDPSGRKAAVERVRVAVPSSVGRRTILLAPTYRGRVRDAGYDTGRLDWRAIHELCLEQDAIFIVRPHPFVRGPLDIPPSLGDRIVDGRALDVDTNDLLLVVDLLITDYSSVIYEFSTLNRPMLFFAYDLETYAAERGFYEPYEGFVPGRIVRTSEELVDAIRRNDCQVEKVRPFALRHVGGTDGRSTDRVVDLITLGRAPSRAPDDPFCR
jgi:CDP-glycerol glycerophosphotransferase (TagB/SpsB family)